MQIQFLNVTNKIFFKKTLCVQMRQGDSYLVQSGSPAGPSPPQKEIDFLKFWPTVTSFIFFFGCFWTCQKRKTEQTSESPFSSLFQSIKARNRCVSLSDLSFLPSHQWWHYNIIINMPHWLLPFTNRNEMDVARKNLILLSSRTMCSRSTLCSKHATNSRRNRVLISSMGSFSPPKLVPIGTGSG